MHPILKNILAVVAGLFIGGIVNMSIINVSASIIPPPEGADIKTLEGLKASMHLFEPKNFIMPFLAHALGTLVGAWIAVFFAATHKMKWAILICLFNLAGGISSVMMLPSPLWYTLVDLIGAYIPMAFLGARLGNLKKN